MPETKQCYAMSMDGKHAFLVRDQQYHFTEVEYCLDCGARNSDPRSYEKSIRDFRAHLSGPSDEPFERGEGV